MPEKREILIEKIESLKAINRDEMTRPDDIERNKAWIEYFMKKLKNNGNNEG